jgi:hypothetical protein
MMKKLRWSVSREDFFPHQQREYWHRGRVNGTMQTEAERKIAKRGFHPPPTGTPFLL